MDGESGPNPQLLKHVFNIELERLLSKIGFHHFPWCLQSHRGIQVGL